MAKEHNQILSLVYLEHKFYLVIKFLIVLFADEYFILI